MALKKTDSTEEKEVSELKNRGKLILDATCAPGDISYPTDLGLLNQARKQTEIIIDLIFEQIKGILEKKPRTYREIARKDYLEVAKKLNLSTHLSRVFYAFLCLFFKNKLFSQLDIPESYNSATYLYHKAIFNLACITGQPLELLFHDFFSNP